MPICRRLLKQAVARAEAFDWLSAGRMMAARIPIIAITTSNSMSEKAVAKLPRLLALFDVEIMHPCLGRLSPSSEQPAVLHGSLYLFEEWRQFHFGLRR